jgi:hypothetical protein
MAKEKYSEHYFRAVKALFILITLIPSIVIAATLKGKVIDGLTHEPLIGAKVIVVETLLGDSTDISGSYIIKDIPVGRVIIQTNMIGYPKILDSVNVVRKEEEVELNVVFPNYIATIIELESQLLSPDEIQMIEAYHDSLEILKRQTNLLTMTIKKLYCNPEYDYNGEMVAEKNERN